MFLFLVLVESALLSAHSQKTVDFNQCVGVENSFALVPCFRAETSTLRSRLVLLISVLHKLFGETFLAFSLCSFLPQLFCFCFGFKTTAKCFSISSRTVCFSLLLFAVTLVFFFCFTFSALRKSSLNKSFKGVPQQGVGGTQQKEHAQNRNRTTTGGMRENPYTQVRINKKNYRLLSCFIYFLAFETAIIPNIYRTAKVYT